MIRDNNRSGGGFLSFSRKRLMSTTVEEFEELLHVEQQIDVGRLSTAAAHGIPESVRAPVWNQLLGIPLFSSAGANSITEYPHYGDTDYIRKVRGETSRYCKRRNTFFKSKAMQAMLEQVVSRYLQNHQALEYTPSLIPLCGPLVYTFQTESESYFALDRVLQMIDEWFSEIDQDQQIANFLMLFRLLLPALYNHFQDEEVNTNELVSDWFRTLFSKQLPLECVLRLWDTYFSSPEKLSLHVYVCLAVLSHFKEDLEDLEQSDIQSFMQRLPAVNIDAVLAQAYQLKFELMERSLVNH